VNAGARDGAPLRVLVVCTGNVCRSPASELLLRAGLEAAADVEVTSAGLSALAGAPVAAPMDRLLAEHGADPAHFVARQLESDDVRGADLVLTMTAAQRRAVVTRVPAAVRRTFTLLEFADVAEVAEVDRLPGGPAERLAAVIQAAPRARALRGGAPEDDIEDPYGRPEEVFTRVFTAIDAAVDRVLRQIREPAATTPHQGARGPAGMTRSGDDTRW
jgi:protein-tyrosine phosphatase